MERALLEVQAVLAHAAADRLGAEMIDKVMSREDVVRRILWAMVDVVLHSEWRRATAVGVHPADYRSMREMCGWWRSTWVAS